MCHKLDIKYGHIVSPHPLLVIHTSGKMQLSFRVFQGKWDLPPIAPQSLFTCKRECGKINSQVCPFGDTHFVIKQWTKSRHVIGIDPFYAPLIPQRYLYLFCILLNALCEWTCNHIFTFVAYSHSAHIICTNKLPASPLLSASPSSLATSFSLLPCYQLLPPPLISASPSSLDISFSLAISFSLLPCYQLLPPPLLSASPSYIDISFSIIPCYQLLPPPLLSASPSSLDIRCSLLPWYQLRPCYQLLPPPLIFASLLPCYQLLPPPFISACYQLLPPPLISASLLPCNQLLPSPLISDSPLLPDYLSSLVISFFLLSSYQIFSGTFSPNQSRVNNISHSIIWDTNP